MDSSDNTSVTSEAIRLPAVGNLPMSASSFFLNDDLALIFGTCLPHAAFVVDPEENCVVAANAKFAAFIGIDFDDFAPPGLEWECLMDPSDRGIFRTWERTLTGGKHVQFELRPSDQHPQRSSTCQSYGERQ